MKPHTLIAALGVLVLARPAFASPDKPVIALANAYYGNTWRHQMVDGPKCTGAALSP